jgi:quinol monooxygenase YgiN
VWQWSLVLNVKDYQEIQMSISFNVTIRVAEKNLAEFNTWRKACMKIVREKERGQTLVYQYTQTNVKSPLYCVTEAYPNGDALLAHFKNLGSDLMAQAVKLIEFQEFVITGDVPADILAQLRALVSEEKITHFSHLVESACGT